MIPHLAFLPWLVGLILCAPMLIFVLYPLYAPYRRRPASTSAGPDSSAMPIQLEGEQAARSALTEVELDYQLGNLAEPDYRSLRERYLRRAFSARKSLQAHEEQLDEIIEARLRQLRETTEQGTEEEEAESYEDTENAE